MLPVTTIPAVQPDGSVTHIPEFPSKDLQHPRTSPVMDVDSYFEV